MKKLEIMRQWMAEGKILHPLEKNPNIVDLTRTLMTLCGYREFNETRWVKVLKQELLDDTYRRRASEHYVLVLIDGLGRNLTEFFPAGGFFDTHYLRELNSVFPSTTACALTSLVTGHWPGRHGLTGWDTYLPDLKRTATILPFVDRMTNASLSDDGLRIEEIVLQPSLMTELEREVCTILPNKIKDGAYSRWAHGATKIIGYRSLPGGFQSVAANVENRQSDSLTYFYLPDLDTAQHETGTMSAKVKRLIKTFDELLSNLRDRLAKHGARLVVSADHGLLDVPPERQVRLETGNRILDFLEAPPSGEPLMPIFHVKPGKERAFDEHFSSSFGSLMELISISDVEALGLFGADGIAAVTRSRLGTFIGIAHEPMVLMYDPPGRRPKEMVAFHGGLQPSSMQVPLFIV